MARQLNLIPPSADDSRSDEDWRLDDATIESGRRGLAKARAALAQAQARLDHDRHHPTAA
jgi:hypothetical protein